MAPMQSRNDPCWCGSGKKWKKCHYPTPSPNTNSTATQYLKQYGIVLKTEEQISKIRKACQVTAEILDQICQAAQIGVTTLELDELSQKLHRERGVIPAPLGYGSPPYPKTICTSLNEVICHGIPERRPLCDGDILNIDVSCILDGVYGDSSRMVILGNPSEERKRVVATAYECLMQAIAVCRPGESLSSIGHAIEDYASSQKCSVVRQFIGHGVGLQFHELPDIFHYANDVQIPMAPGMIFTIEPMINAGVPDAIISPIDHWTATTQDGRASAQWEHTILITPTGHEILTAHKNFSLRGVLS